MLNYLATHTADPLSEPALREHLYSKVATKFDLNELFQVKRLGKDADDLFFQFGKIHGLENIAYVSEEDLKKAAGNPVALQLLVNKVDGPTNVPTSHEESVKLLRESLAKYKAEVEKLGLHTSDRKKLLSLPFYMAKRSEKPVPKPGQKEMKIFEEIYGMGWFDDAHTKTDDEEKITEFNYEQYFSPEMLKGIDCQGESFKDFIKTVNLTTRTQHEAL